MRHLDDVDRAEVASAEELVLRLLAEVAEEDGGQPCPARPDHDAAVVARQHRSRRSGWPQHLPVQRSELAALPASRLLDRHAAVGELREHSLVRLPIGCAHERPPDPVDDAGQPTAVVGVVVRQHQEVHPLDPEPRQAGRRRVGLPPHVDHPDLPRSTDQQRVPLPHVARGHLPVRRPRKRLRHHGAAEDSPVGRHTDEEPARRHRADEPRQACASGQQRDQDEGEHAEHHAQHPVRPGQRSRG